MDLMRGYLMCMCDYILLDVLEVELLPINVVCQSVYHIAVSRNKSILLSLDPQSLESCNGRFVSGSLSIHDALYERFGGVSAIAVEP